MANHTRKFDDAQRKAIADDIRATAGTPEGSVRKIAGRHGIKSPDTVRKIAAEYRVAEDFALTSDDADIDDTLIVPTPTTRQVTEGPPEIWEFTARGSGSAAARAHRRNGM